MVTKGIVRGDKLTIWKMFLIWWKSRKKKGQKPRKRANPNQR